MKADGKDGKDSGFPATKPGNKGTILNQAQRDEITRRVLAKERAVGLAKEFGVSKAYVSLLKQQALNPERYRKIREAKFSRKLTDAELAAFREALASGTPESHGLVPALAYWTKNLAGQLSQKMFGKAVSVRVLEECLPTFKPVMKPWKYERPQPPGPREVSRLSPELAADPEFVAWYLSPIAAQIEQRSYEAAVRDYDERYDADGNLKPVYKRQRGRPPAKPKPVSNEAEPPPDEARLSENGLREEMLAMEELEGNWPELEHWPLASDAVGDVLPEVPAPGQRTGKHAKNKGTNFTPPKRRKKRR